MDDLLTVPEACRFLRISRASLYALFRQNRLKKVKVLRKRTVIRRSDIDAFVQASSLSNGNRLEERDSRDSNVHDDSPPSATSKR